jgi:glycosyltransferase involved in cell wall biosynthesis
LIYPEATDDREPLVAVIIATYNYGRFIAEALESVRAQTCDAWECVVVDDGSTDDTADVVQRIAANDRRIRFVHQANAGPNAARNAGVDRTRAPFLQFLDADDLIGPSKLARQLDLFSCNPEAALLYGGVKYFRGANPLLAPGDTEWIDLPPLRSVSGSGDAMVGTLLEDNILVIEAPLVRRSAFESALGFDPRIRRLEDWELWLRMALHGAAFVYDDAEPPDSISYVRVHAQSSSQDRAAMLKADLLVRKSIHGSLPTPELRRLNMRRIREQWAGLGIVEALDGSLGEGVRYLVRAGIAQRRPKWIVWACAAPFLRLPRARRVLEAWREARKPT